MTALVGQLTALRRRFPQLRARHWVDGRRPDGSYGVLWLTPQAQEMTEKDWNFPEGRFLSYVLGPLEKGQPPLYVVLNASPATIDFVLPTVPDCNRWTSLINTAAAEQEQQEFKPGAKSQAPARSVLMFSGAA
jgi:glycogen operon protein